MTAAASSSSSAQDEIARIMACVKNKADTFAILGLDIEICAFPDIAKKYRRIVVLIHPDKCKLPHASDAFTVVEKAYRAIPDEGILNRLKVAYQKKKEREAKLKVEAEKRQANGGGSGGAATSGVVDNNLSKEERMAKMKAAAREDEYLEAARRAHEAALKKSRHEKRQAEDAVIAAALQRQIDEEKGMNLF